VRWHPSRRPDFVFGLENGSKFIGNLCMLRQERLLIDVLPSLDLFAVFDQRGVDARVFGTGMC
jgi:hypothetical protein